MKTPGARLRAAWEAAPIMIPGAFNALTARLVERLGFPAVYLSGGALSFMAVTVLVCLGFRRAGILKDTITFEHYHDLGKWLFALTAFYTYIGFA